MCFCSGGRIRLAFHREASVSGYPYAGSASEVFRACLVDKNMLAGELADLLAIS